MATIDASIPLQVQPFKAPDPLQAAQQVYTLKNMQEQAALLPLQRQGMMQQLEHGQLQNEGMRSAQADAAALKSAYKFKPDNSGDIDYGPTRQGLLAAGKANLIPQLNADEQKHNSARAELSEKNAKAINAWYDHHVGPMASFYQSEIEKIKPGEPGSELKIQAILQAAQNNYNVMAEQSGGVLPKVTDPLKLEGLAQMAASNQEAHKKRLEAAQPTATMKELSSIPGMTPDNPAWKTNILASQQRGTTVQNIMPKVEQSARTEVNKDFVVKEYRPTQEAAHSAAALDRVSDAIGSIKLDTGWGTEQKGAAANILAGFGIGGKQLEEYAGNVQMFQKFVMDRNWEVLSSAKGVQTEGDSQRALKTWEQLSNTTRANQFISDFSKAINGQAQAKAKFYRQNREKAAKQGDLALLEDMWLESPEATKSIFDFPSMKKWAGGAGGAKPKWSDADEKELQELERKAKSNATK